ncbi:MAG TPA: 5-formyltetrahydrofolate cyclo-ligase [Treponema sp.]|nr:5-formyltetrahydrofolate cyclo-ligase [Treponema sp.]
MNNKATIRKKMKTLLAQEANSPEDRPVTFDRPHIIFNDGTLITPQNCATLLGYLPFGNEADPREAMRQALEKGISVGVPRLYGPNMRFHRITSLCDPFETNQYGILEPPEYTTCIFAQDTAEHTQSIAFPLLVLIPALAFSRDGARLGRGGGYYDRFLSTLLTRHSKQRNQINLAGVCRAIQIVDHLPQETHDISVDCLYTYREVY